MSPLPRLIVFLLAGCALLPAQEARLATGWRVFADDAARDAASLAPGEAGLVAADLEAAGWTLRPEHRVEAGSARLTIDDEGITVVGETACLLLLPRHPGPAHVRLDDRFGLALLDAGGGRVAALIPGGERRVTVDPIPVMRNAVEWWFAVLGAAVVAAVLAALVHALIGRRDPHVGPSPPRARFGAWAALMLLVGAAWAWIIPLPYVALDYGLAHLAPAQIRGLVPGAQLADDSPYAAIMGNSIFFRPAHHTVWGLEQAVFGASPEAMHAMSLVWHLVNVTLLWLLLLRFVPRGAFAGALLGGLWPVAGQALTWVITRQLPQSLTFGLLALLLALRYLRTGRAGSLMGLAASLWLTLATKESGVVHLAIVGLFAPLGSLPAWRWRRLFALGTVLVLLAGLYVSVRLGLGYGLSQGYGGLTFRTPLHIAHEGLVNLPHVFQASLALTNTGEEYGPPGWILAAVLGVLGLFAGRRGLPLVLACGVISGLCALPDAIWPRNWCAPALARGCYIPALLVWGSLGASAAVAALRVSGRGARIVLLLPLVLAVAATVPGHLAERKLRLRMAEIAADWVHTVAREVEANDPRGVERLGPEEAARGPAGFVVIGRPRPTDLPEVGSIIGPSLGPWIRPPFATRIFSGEHVSSDAQARGVPFASTWPWEVMILASPGAAEPPRYRETLSPITGALPRPAVLRKVDRGAPGPAIHRIETGPGSRRGVTALALRFAETVPAGTRIAFHGSRPGEDASLEFLTTTLVAPRGPEHPLLMPTEVIDGWVGRRAFTDLELHLTGPDGDPHGLEPAIELRHGLERCELIAPAPQVVVTRDQVLPPIRIRDRTGADAFRVALVPSAQFHSAFPPRDFPVPRAAFRVVGGALELDLLAHFRLSPEQWKTGLDPVAASLPNLDGFWLLIDVRGLAGNPPLEQSRSNVVPIKIGL